MWRRLRRVLLFLTFAFFAAVTISYILEQRSLNQVRVIEPRIVEQLGQTPEELARCAGFFGYQYKITESRRTRQFFTLLLSAAMSPPTDTDRVEALMNTAQEEIKLRADRMQQAVETIMSDGFEEGFSVLFSSKEADKICVEIAVKLRDLVRKS